jgi:hypothetical protein
MAKRAMKLFAVTILAGAACAPRSASAGTLKQPKPPTQTAVEGFSGIDWDGKIDITAMKPRLLANGSAACGNVVGGASKGGGGYKAMACEDEQDFITADTAEQRALLAASLAYQSAEKAPLVIKPRVLANFRPACGNTGGKVDAPADCTTAEIKAANASNEAYARASDAHYSKVSAAYTKLMAATTAAVRADPSLKMRLLVSGRPACGNTQGKASPPEFCRVTVAEIDQ